MDANETRHDYAQKLREVKEIPASGHRDIARREIIRLEAENTRLRTALEDIANPLQRIKREMPEGVKLNGQMAVALMESPDFYKDIARQELGYE